MKHLTDYQANLLDNETNFWSGHICIFVANCLSCFFHPYKLVGKKAYNLSNMYTKLLLNGDGRHTYSPCKNLCFHFVSENHTATLGVVSGICKLPAYLMHLHIISVGQQQKRKEKNSKKRKESNISNICICVVRKHGQVRIWLSSLAPPLPPNPQAPSWVLENPTKTSVHIQHRNPKILKISRASMWIEKKNQTKIPPPKQNQYASGLRPCGLAIFGSRLETGKQFK
jgi:hypothetical protein